MQDDAAGVAAHLPQRELFYLQTAPAADSIEQFDQSGTVLILVVTPASKPQAPVPQTRWRS